MEALLKVLLWLVTACALVNGEISFKGLKNVRGIRKLQDDDVPAPPVLNVDEIRGASNITGLSTEQSPLIGLQIQAEGLLKHDRYQREKSDVATGRPQPTNSGFASLKHSVPRSCGCDCDCGCSEEHREDVFDLGCLSSGFRGDVLLETFKEAGKPVYTDVEELKFPVYIQLHSPDTFFVSVTIKHTYIWTLKADSFGFVTVVTGPELLSGHSWSKTIEQKVFEFFQKIVRIQCLHGKVYIVSKTGEKITSECYVGVTEKVSVARFSAIPDRRLAGRCCGCRLDRCIDAPHGNPEHNTFATQPAWTFDPDFSVGPADPIQLVDPIDPGFSVDPIRPAGPVHSGHVNSAWPTAPSASVVPVQPSSFGPIEAVDPRYFFASPMQPAQAVFPAAQVPQRDCLRWSTPLITTAGGFSVDETATTTDQRRRRRLQAVGEFFAVIEFQADLFAEPAGMNAGSTRFIAKLSVNDYAVAAFHVNLAPSPTNTANEIRYRASVADVTKEVTSITREGEAVRASLERLSTDLVEEIKLTSSVGVSPDFEVLSLYIQNTKITFRKSCKVATISASRPVPMTRPAWPVDTLPGYTGPQPVQPFGMLAETRRRRLQSEEDQAVTDAAEALANVAESSGASYVADSASYSENGIPTGLLEDIQGTPVVLVCSNADSESQRNCTLKVLSSISFTVAVNVDGYASLVGAPEVMHEDTNSENIQSAEKALFDLVKNINKMSISNDEVVMGSAFGAELSFGPSALNKLGRRLRALSMAAAGRKLLSEDMPPFSVMLTDEGTGVYSAVMKVVRIFKFRFQSFDGVAHLIGDVMTVGTDLSAEEIEDRLMKNLYSLTSAVITDQTVTFSTTVDSVTFTRVQTRRRLQFTEGLAKEFLDRTLTLDPAESDLAIDPIEGATAKKALKEKPITLTVKKGNCKDCYHLKLKGVNEHSFEIKHKHGKAPVVGPISSTKKHGHASLKRYEEEVIDHFKSMTRISTHDGKLHVKSPKGDIFFF